MTEIEFIQALKDGKTLVATVNGYEVTLKPITSEHRGMAWHFHSNAPEAWDSDFIVSDPVVLLKMLNAKQMPPELWQVKSA